VTEVDRVNPKVGNLYVKKAPAAGSAFSMKTGKNRFHHKGQVSLVVPMSIGVEL
jgi:hypothetical protein